MSIAAFGGGVRFKRVEPSGGYSDTFIDLFPVGVPRYGAGAFIHGNKLFIVGGVSERGIVGTVEAIDMETGSREYPAVLPEPRAFFAHGYANGKFYIIGGLGRGAAPQTSIYELDPETGEVVEKGAALPKGVAYCGSAVLNGKIYVIGGIDSDGNILSDVYEYDPSTDTVAQKAPLNVARENTACAELNGYIYCLGGDDGSSKLDTVERYDPSTDTWQLLSLKLPSPITGARAARIVIDSKTYILVVGG